MSSLKTLIEPGIALEEQGDFPAALQYYRDLRNTHPAVLIRMAYVAQKLGESDLAFKMHRTAAISQTVRHYADCHLDARLPRKTILLAGYGPWFPFAMPDVTELLEQRDYHLMETSVVFPPSTSLSNLTPATALKFVYRDIPLMDIASYETCVFLELIHPGELDPGNPVHWAFLRPSLARAAAMVDYYFYMFQFYQPEYVVYPQGYMPASAAMRLVAQKMRIKTVAFEFTCFKDRILCETQTGISVTHNSVAAVFKEHDKTIAQADADAFWQSYYKTIITHKTDEHVSPAAALHSGQGDSNQKTFLYLGQVGTDSSVLFGSPYFKSQARLILDIAKHVLAQGHRFIVKLHPKEKNGVATIDAKPYRQLTLRKMQEHADFAALSQNANFIIDADNAYSTYNMIEQADVCLTINSQTGLEAACLGKAVIVCGQCMYQNSGFTQTVQTIPALEGALDQVMSGAMPATDADRARRFFYSYMNNSSIKREPDAFVALLTKA